jgi:hypothetical protein
MKPCRPLFVLACASVGVISGQSVFAQPGHPPFDYGTFEIENFERSLAPNGIVGATVVDIGIAPGYHPAAWAAGHSVGYTTGAPLYLEDSAAAYEPFGGILGHQGPGPVNGSNYENIFPGGFAVSPFASQNLPNQPSYNGTKLSLVTNTDGNLSDDVGITSGNQALRISMRNVGQGDGNTSFDRPAALFIKAVDFWGIADTRFQTLEMVRDAPSDYLISLDVTYLADEIPDTCACDSVAPGHYFRTGLISGHGGAFDESPPSQLQGPPSLVANSGDADGDGVVNFSDRDFVDANNTPGLPGFGIPGVFQRRYQFPAEAMSWPHAPLADAPDVGNREATGGLSNAYMIGFTINGNWALNDRAAIIVDNIRVVPKFIGADFNQDGFMDHSDWEIMMSNMNSLTASTYAEGDLGGIGEIGLCDTVADFCPSPGKVDFEDFVVFERIWDTRYGENGLPSLGSGTLASVPEPAMPVLLVWCLGSWLTIRQRKLPYISTDDGSHKPA